jgi:hypothetical protein
VITLAQGHAIVRRGANPATEEEVLVNSDHIISITGDAGLISVTGINYCRSFLGNT